MLTVLDATPPAGAVIGAAAGVCLILFLAAIAGTRRMRIGGADPPLLKRRLRFSYFAIAWASLLPLAMLGLWLTGHALIAVLVLIAYAILAVRCCTLGLSGRHNASGRACWARIPSG